MWHEEWFKAFFQAMREEWLYAREDNYPFHSLHEGYAVLLEEVEELKIEMFKKAHLRDEREILKECIQIATMAMCIASECTASSITDIEHYRVE